LECHYEWLDCRTATESKNARLKLIFLTMNEDPDLAWEAMRAGAAGYLPEEKRGLGIIPCDSGGFRGKFYVTPQIARGMQEAFVRNPEAKRRRTTVTPRQREVLQLLAKQIHEEAADVLNVSARTVAFHKSYDGRIRAQEYAGLIQYAIKSHIERHDGAVQRTF